MLIRSRPLTMMEPCMGSYTRVMQLKTVVLPAPLGPIIENISPFSTEKETLSSAKIPPKRIESSSTFSSANRAPSSYLGRSKPGRPWINLFIIVLGPV